MMERCSARFGRSATALRCLQALSLACALCAGAACAQEAALARAAVLEDLEQFRIEVFERDMAFTPAARAQASQRLAALRERAGRIDASRLSLELAQLMALADNGHSLSYPSPRVHRSNRVALRLAPFGADFYVLRTREAQRELLGARLLAIDGVPIARLREAARSLQGGLPSWRDRQAPFLFESPQQLQAMGLSRSASAADYAFELADGTLLTRRLEGQAPARGRPHSDTARLLLPGVQEGQQGWVGLLPAEQAPWSLRDPDAWFRLDWRDDLHAVVIDLRVSNDTAQLKLADFLAQAQAAIERHRPEHLVLDLRQNGGGDLTKGRDFVASLPQRVPGQIYVLTSPWTFSAAISLSGYLKQAAPERVHIVGEALGDRLEFFAEGRPVQLRHLGDLMLMATERHDYQHGCRQQDDCHAPVRERPIAVTSLAPEVAAPWTIAAYRQGIDPAMQAVAALLPRPGPCAPAVCRRPD